MSRQLTNAEILEQTGIDIDARVAYQIESGKWEAEVFDDFRCWASSSTRARVAQWIREAVMRTNPAITDESTIDVAAYFNHRGGMILSTHKLFHDWLWTYDDKSWSMGFDWIYNATKCFRTDGCRRLCSVHELSSQWSSMLDRFR